MAEINAPAPPTPPPARERLTPRPGTQRLVDGNVQGHEADKDEGLSRLLGHPTNQPRVAGPIQRSFGKAQISRTRRAEQFHSPPASRLGGRESASGRPRQARPRVRHSASCAGNPPAHGVKWREKRRARTAQTRPSRRDRRTGSRSVGKRPQIGRDTLHADLGRERRPEPGCLALGQPRGVSGPVSGFSPGGGWSTGSRSLRKRPVSNPMSARGMSKVATGEWRAAHRPCLATTRAALSIP